MLGVLGVHGDAMSDVEIPREWVLEHAGYAQGYSVLSTPSPNLYRVTVDWEKRTFRSGMTTIGAPLSKRRYKGCHWRQELVNDAVTWLAELMK